MDPAINPIIDSQPPKSQQFRLLAFLFLVLLIGIYIVVALLFNLYPFQRHVIAPGTEYGRSPTPTASESSLISPNPQALDTSNWQTYRNEQYGFELQLPPSWSVDPTRSNRQKSGDDIVFNFGITESHESISRYEAKGRSLNEYMQSTFGKVIGNLPPNGVPNNIIIDSEFGKEFTPLKGSDNFSVILVKHNDYIYRFVTSGYLKNSGILSTFKFTK